MTTQAPSTTNKTTGTTSVPGAGGCSPFDFSTCDPNCVIMDAQGCLSCQCKGAQNSNSPSSSDSGKYELNNLVLFFSHNGCSKWSVNVCNCDVGSRRWRVSFLRFQHLWPKLCGNGRTGLYVMSLPRYFYKRANVVTCIRFAIYRSELNCISVSDM